MDNALVEPNTGQYFDPTTVLPDELVSEIFRKLHFDGRVVASHVCASWRRIALSDRRLWAEYSIFVRRTRGGDGGKAGLLSTLLTRSDPLPFCLECEPDVPNAIAELVIAHMARMEELYLGRFETDDALQRILAQDVPMLKRFSAYRGLVAAPMQISTRWASAPRLKHLTLACSAVWPANCIFPALLSYTGGVPEGPGADLPLAQMFPNLEVMYLDRVTQASLPRLAPLPPCLTSLKLRTGDIDVGIDCAALLRDCGVPLLRELLIESTNNASSVFELIRLFERSVDGPWRLHMYADIIGIRAPLYDPPSYRYYAVCLDRSFRIRIAEIVPLCGRLWDLDLELADLLSLCASNAAPPALTSISIILTGEEDSGMANSLQNTPGIQAPALQSLRLSTGFRFDKPIAGFLDRIIHAVRSPRLATIFVDTDNPSDAFDNDEIIAFLALAARLEVRTRAGDAVCAFGQAASSDDRAVGEGATGAGRD